MSRSWPAAIPDAAADIAALAHRLRAHAAGLPAETAAVDLLIGHRHRLTRPGFAARFVHPVTSGGRHMGAWIDWAAAVAALDRGDLPCSASEATMLRIAASLAADLPVALRDALGGLDTTNIAAVTAAITAANGT
jgi:hypothetical protein